MKLCGYLVFCWFNGCYVENKVSEILPVLFKTQLYCYYYIGGLTKNAVTSSDYVVSKCGIISGQCFGNDGEGSRRS